VTESRKSSHENKQSEIFLFVSKKTLQEKTQRRIGEKYRTDNNEDEADATEPRGFLES